MSALFAFKIAAIGVLLNVAVGLPYYFFVERRGARNEEERNSSAIGVAAMCAVPWLEVLLIVFLLSMIPVLYFARGWRGLFLDEEARAFERAVLADQSDAEARRSFHAAVERLGWGQCDECGGSLFGIEGRKPCAVCKGLGALPPGHARIRCCALEACSDPLPPSHVAVYCSNECAWEDA